MDTKITMVTTFSVLLAGLYNTQIEKQHRETHAIHDLYSAYEFDPKYKALIPI